MNRCYGALAPVALANDYAVVPCRGKIPYPKDWPNAGKEQMERWTVDFPDANVGLVCGPVTFLDLDIDEPILLGIAQQQVMEILGPSSYVVGRTNTCRIKIAYRTQDDVRKGKIPVEGENIEILARGQQGVVAGKLEGGLEYFGGEDVLATPKEELPLVTAEMLDKLKKFFAGLKISPVVATQDDFNPLEASFPRQGEGQVVERPVNPAKYAHQVLNQKLNDVRSADEGGRNDALFKAAVRIQQVIETGEGDVPQDWRQKLTQAAASTGLFPSEIEATIKSGEERGGRDGPLWESVAEGKCAGEKSQKPLNSGRVSAKELLRRTFPPQKFIVNDLLVPGLTVVAGAPKTGKSWMMLQLATAIAEGNSFLDCRSRKTEVLYVACEDSEIRMADRLKKLKSKESDNLLFDWGRDAKIPELICSGAGVVILDTIQRVRPVDGKSYDYAADVKFSGEVQEFAQQNGVSVIAVTHTRKETTEDWLHQVTGTSGITGSADTVMLLRRDRSEERGVLHVTSRDFRERDISLIFSEDTACWRPTTTHQPPQSPRSKILAALEDATLSLDELAAAAGMSRSNLCRAVKPLIDDGAVYRPARGRYALT